MRSTLNWHLLRSHQPPIINTSLGYFYRPNRYSRYSTKGFSPILIVGGGGNGQRSTLLPRRQTVILITLISLRAGYETTYLEAEKISQRMRRPKCSRKLIGIFYNLSSSTPLRVEENGDVLDFSPIYPPLSTLTL